MKREMPEPYNFEDKDIDPLIGAQLLGYRMIRLQPGNASFPRHFHHFGEEMFYVIEGKCTCETPRGDIAVTKGDFIACPPGPAGAHKFVNTGNAPCTLIVVGTVMPHDVSEYPDSNKVYPYISKQIFRKDNRVSYWEGEV